MITKRTDELKPGDVVMLYGRESRAVASVTPTITEGLLRVQYEPIGTAAASGRYAEAEDEWRVDAPSPLDLAVQRAQELATQYDHRSPSVNQALQDYGLLLDLFRAAR